MLVAQQKQQENIAEYVLYLFQIEDLIRSLNFDIDQIMESVVRPSLPDRSFESQYRKWYAELIQEMKRSNLTKKGHLDRVMEVMKELVFLHNTLLSVKDENNKLGQIDPYKGKNTAKYGIENEESVGVELVYNFESSPKEVNIICKSTMAISADSVFFKQAF